MMGTIRKFPRVSHVNSPSRGKALEPSFKALQMASNVKTPDVHTSDIVANTAA